MENNSPSYKGVSRNASCPCGSGARFKNCHGCVSKIQKNHIENQFLTELFRGDDLFCSVTGRCYKLSEENQYLFVAENADTGIQLDAASLHFLKKLETFSTFNNHFDKCSSGFSVSKEQFKKHLEVLYHEGVVKTAQAITNSLQIPAKSSFITEIGGVCISTCEAPSRLETILNCQVRRKYRFNVKEKIFVFDDSSSEESIAKNREIVAKASTEIEVNYLGIEWQRKFVKKLTNEFPEIKIVIEKMLLPQEGISCSGGRIMNLALLFFAGKRYLNFDDEAILDDALIHKDASRTIQLGIRPNKLNYDCEGVQQIIEAGDGLKGDPLALHKDALGLSLAGLSAKQENYHFNVKSFSGLTYSEAKSFQSNPIITTTGNGEFGTSAACNIWDYASQAEITSHGYSIPSGINNSQLLAATIPSCKGEGSLLCFMASILYPSSVHLELPWSLAHFCEPTHCNDGDNFSEEGVIRIPDLIMDLVLKLNLLSSLSVAEKIDLIAATLLKAAQQSEVEFRAQLKLFQVKTSAELLKKLNKQVDMLSIDDASYKVIIEQIISNELANLERPALPQIESASGSNEFEQMKWAQQQLKAYSEGLSVWFKLWEFCSDQAPAPENIAIPIIAESATAGTHGQ